MKQIPKIIHLIFLANEEKPKIFNHCLKRIKEINSDWAVNVYDNQAANRFIKKHFQFLSEFYHSIDSNVQKSDFLRVLLVFKFGGFYMDLDMYSLKNLNGLIDFDLVIGEEKTISEEERSNLNLNYHLRIANYMFGGKPNHAFWLDFIKEMINKMSSTAINSENDILETSGPGLLTDVYHESGKKYQNIVLLRNIDRRCLIPNHNKISCFFGNYAAHLHQGTWRNKVNSKENKTESTKLDHYPKIDDVKFELIPRTNFSITSSNLQHLPNLQELYTIMEDKYYVDPSEDKETGPHISFLNSKTLLSTNFYRDSRNILIFYKDQATDNLDYIEVINTKFKFCIVFNEFTKTELLRCGTRIPIKVFDLGIKSIPRQFGDDEINYSTFNVAISEFQNERILQIIECFKEIRNKYIPELELNIIQETKNSAKPCNFPWVNYNNKNSSISLKNLFDRTHVYCQFDENDELELGIKSFIYMGIPILEFTNEDPSDFKEVILKKINDSYKNYNSLSSTAINLSEKCEDEYSMLNTQNRIHNLLINLDE